MLATKTPIFSMIFGKGECRCTQRTSNENLPKSTEIAAFWQGLYYSCLAYAFLIVNRRFSRVIRLSAREDRSLPHSIRKGERLVRSLFSCLKIFRRGVRLTPTLFSFRTQKLSFAAPKVLVGWPAGRIGRCHIIFLDSSAAGQPYRCPPKRQQQGQALAEDTKRKFVSLNFPKIFLDSSAAEQPYRFPPKRQQQGQALAEDTNREFVSWIS